MTISSQQFGQQTIDVVLNEGQMPAKLSTDSRGNTVLNGEVTVANATGVAVTDTAIIDAAIATAGVNGVIQFPPNQTYVTYGGHELLSGQRVHLNGAVLKRFDQKSSTLVTTIPYGSAVASIQVADASQFAVGMQVGATVDDGVVGAYGNTANYAKVGKITAIDTGTNTVTVSPGLTASNTGGAYKALSAANSAKLVTCGPLIRAGFSSGVGLAWASLPTDILIADGEIDGNKANNTLGRWWDMSPTMQLAMHYGQVRGIRCSNGMSDDIIHSGIGNRIYKNSSLESSGNFSHPSSWDGTNGVTDVVVDGNYVKNCTRDTTIGHSDGALIHSNQNTGLVYSSNTVDGSNQWGVGSGFNNTDTQVVYVGNIIKNCLNGAFRCNGGTDFVFTGNVCVDNGQDIGAASVQVSVIERGSTRVSVTNNTFNNTPVLVRNGGGGDPAGLAIVGNAFYGLADRTANWKLAHLWLNGVGNCEVSGNTFTGGTASTSWDGILVSSGTTNANITGNKFLNGRSGIFLNATTVTGVAIKGNEIIDPYDTGILQQGSGASKQLTISDNDIKLSSGATIASTWKGINVTSNTSTGFEPALVQNNSIRSEKTSGTQRGIYLSGADRATIINNRVRMGHSGAVTIDASAVVGAGVILLDNECMNTSGGTGIGTNMSGATKIHNGTDTNRVLTVA